MRNILNIKYDKDNRYHNMLFASIVFILVLIAVMIPSPPRQTVEYPAYKVEYLDQYGKQFDASYRYSPGPRFGRASKSV